MKPVDVVCLCDNYDLKEFFGGFFAENNPWIRLRSPNEISEPEQIEHALAFMPGPDAFEPYPNLRLVSSAGAGVDALLSNPSLKSNVAVSRVVIAEQAQMLAAFAIWYVVSWQRQMWEYTPLQEKHEWHPINRTPPSKFSVGILGYGSIGSALAKSLRGLGYPVIAYGSKARMDGDIEVVGGVDGLTRLANESNAVVNLLPLTPSTRGILSAEFFAKMRTDSILINLGRGAHLLEQDLIDALNQNQLGMAALDTFTEEPLPSDHPFWQHDKIRVTPHVAGDADYHAIAQFVARGIEQFEAGKMPAGLVDRIRGY